MKVVVLYRPHSEGALAVEKYASEFQAQNPASHLELKDIDSREGANMAQLYDLAQFPTILVITDDGQLVRLWQGQSMPLMSELAASAQS